MSAHTLGCSGREAALHPKVGRELSMGFQLEVAGSRLFLRAAFKCQKLEDTDFPAEE